MSPNHPPINLAKSLMKEARITRAKNGYIVQYIRDVPIYLKIYRSWPEAMEAVSRFFALGDDEKPKKGGNIRRKRGMNGG